MTELLTAAQMRAIEQDAMASGSVSGLELMERAGDGVVAAVFDHWPHLAAQAHHAVVLCGPGNNGGDGFVIARLLAFKGWRVDVVLMGDGGDLPADAQVNFDRWSGMGAVKPLVVNDVFPNGIAADLYVDALFGAGLTRPLTGAAAAVMRRLATDHADRTVAVDAPSGLCLDSGRILAVADAASGDGRPYQGRAAALTVTFDSPKTGHMLADGPKVCGTLVVKDIGLHDWRCAAPTRPATKLVTLDPLVPDPRASMRTDIRAVARKSGDAGHKFDYGHALVLSGGAGRTGAARLAARGALRIGAGLVTLGVPPSAQMEVATQITALMLTRVADADALSAALEDDRITALCLGPALGVGDHAAALVDVVLHGGHLRPARRVVFDADALTLIAADAARMTALNEHAVLTPHGGELKRLFPEIAERLAATPTHGPAYSKLDATRDAAASCGAVVLFKGADTVIAHPDGRAAVHCAGHGRAAPWLSTAGAGDVLAGFITGLLARGLDPMQAAECAAWLHVECARSFGAGLIAEDIPEALPIVLSALD